MIGVMEYWSVGVMGRMMSMNLPILHYSNTPSLQLSHLAGSRRSLIGNKPTHLERILL
jgi:hypothetical protein